MFVPGQVYRRRDLHAKYGGQQQGGISTPANFPFLLLFTGDSGSQYGYTDGWQDDGIFYYTGEGQRGHMRMASGNKAIADHSANRKDLHLFGQAHRSHVRYMGQFVATGSHLVSSRDVRWQDRKVIVFELVQIEEFTDPEETLSFEGELPRDLAQLRALVIDGSVESRSAKIRSVLWRKRSAAVKRYVLKRSNGICEGCRQVAPFHTQAGDPYLEPHHILRLSDGGPDHPR